MSINKNVKKITVPEIVNMKKQGEKITALTAYDVLMAQILDDSGIDIILVGDSAGMVMSGYENTLAVTMEEMLFYCKSVRRGVKRALLIADMPFLSYQTSIEEAIKNAGRFLQEAGMEAVKIEGGKAVKDIVKKLVGFGVPVMGHIGLTPQSIHQFGGYGLRGKDDQIAKQLLEDAFILQEAGAFSIVLEKIPSALAKEITNTLDIPTIGIGAGKDCDGQILVSHDMLGLYEKFKPKFVRHYAELGKSMREAFNNYINDVKNTKFPSEDESY
ncbi:MAG: 3-methyl-2-oxobutanoate hydroxymethyltransferase [Calditrichales bacterium]|nr:3-methyl-2-oxobutanoate hydroxymethyltransferase [Calditrichales bacterium]